MLSILRSCGLVIVATVFVISEADASGERPSGKDFVSIRAWVERQPRSFENEILFSLMDGEIVRSQRFTIAGAIFGDYDGDDDIDRYDYTAFQICLSFSGPGVTTPPACYVFDSDGDFDIDMQDVAAFQLVFTGALGGIRVEAGGLIPGRPSPSFYLSGVPGTPGNNALNGSANQLGVPSNAIATEWTITSQPAGSGAVTFSNSALLATAYRIGPPARAGAYIFTLTATNLFTSETAFDSVVLELLPEPVVRVADEQSPMRVVMQRGTASVDLNLLYTAASEAFIEVFDGKGDDPENLIDVISVPAGVDAAASATISALGNREDDPPDLYYLQGRISDIVDVGPIVDLDNPNPTPDRNSLNKLLLFTTDSWFESHSPLTPKVIELYGGVGEVDGSGINHQGIGSDNAYLSVKYIENGADRHKIADINEDGFDDLIVLSFYGIDIYFGALDIVTKGYDARGLGGDIGWPYSPDLDIYSNEDFHDFCVGDINGDGHLDIVTVTNTGANFVEVWLMDGAVSMDRGYDADRTYTADSDGNVDLNLFVLCGDVGIGAGVSGIDDIIVVSEGYDDNEGAAASNDGVVFVIYGREDLPNSTDIEAHSVTGLTTTNQNGERIFDSASGAFPNNNDADHFGTIAALGQWDSGALDLVVGEGWGTGTTRIYLGGVARISRNPARVYTAPEATPSTALRSGDAILDDVTGDGKSELVVRSHELDTVYTVPNGLANTSLDDPQIIKYDTASFQLPLFWGGTAVADLKQNDQLAAGDIDGDGVNELLIGNSNEDRVIVVKGPISSDIESPSEVYRIYEDSDSHDIGTSILFGDVTGDGLVDFMMGGTYEDVLVILQGFFTTTMP